jgi:hypothetical protein
MRHDARLTARIYDARSKPAPPPRRARAATRALVELSFPDAPHAASPASVDALIRSHGRATPRRHPTGNGGTPATTASRIRAGKSPGMRCAESSSATPASAVLGFSQGAAVAAAVAALSCRGDFPPLAFVILIAGFTPRSAELGPLFEPPLQLPSLHIWGEQDPLRSTARAWQRASPPTAADRDLVGTPHHPHPGRGRRRAARVCGEVRGSQRPLARFDHRRAGRSDELHHGPHFVLDQRSEQSLTDRPSHDPTSASLCLASFSLCPPRLLCLAGRWLSLRVPRRKACPLRVAMSAPTRRRARRDLQRIWPCLHVARLTGESGLNGDGHRRQDTMIYWSMDMAFGEDGIVWSSTGTITSCAACSPMSNGRNRARRSERIPR